MNGCAVSLSLSLCVCVFFLTCWLYRAPCGAAMSAALDISVMYLCMSVCVTVIHCERRSVTLRSTMLQLAHSWTHNPTPPPSARPLAPAHAPPMTRPTGQRSRCKVGLHQCWKHTLVPYRRHHFSEPRQLHRSFSDAIFYEISVCSRAARRETCLPLKSKVLCRPSRAHRTA